MAESEEELKILLMKVKVEKKRSEVKVRKEYNIIYQCLMDMQKP